MAASDKVLGALHEQLARVLMEMLEPKEVHYQEATDEQGDDGETVFKDMVRVEYPPANVLAVAAKFLKDNNITATIESDPALAGLAGKLRERGRISDNDVREAVKLAGNNMLQ